MSFGNQILGCTRRMDANWVSLTLILATVLFLSSSACVLKVTTPEVEVGKTANVSLECSNPYPALDISDILVMRILKWDHDEWNGVAELQRGNDAEARQDSKDVFVEGRIGCVAKSFLRLTWPVATNDTIGLYLCDLVSLAFQEAVVSFKSLPVFIKRKTVLTVQMLLEIVAENKRKCFQQLRSQKQDLLENITATAEVLGASFESQLKNQLQPKPCVGVQGPGPRPVVVLSSGMKVVCDTETDGGGWLVIQRRASGDVDFYRGWTEYKNGFGNLNGNFWFGLEKIHQLTNQGRYQLRIDLKYKEKYYYASYKNFSLSGESENYKIHVSGFSGNVKDSMAAHNGQQFSTKDRDNDQATFSCATKYHGAWWYKYCHQVHLNGVWGSTVLAKGLNWASLTGWTNSVSFSEMKIRPNA